MRCARLLLPCVLLLWASTAGAFEGVLELDLKVDGKTTRGRATLTEGGDVRVDLTVPAGSERLHTSLIVLGSNDELLIQALHATRTFERRRMPGAGEDVERFSVTPAGKRQVAGRQAQGFLVTDTKSGDRFSVWLDPTLGDLTLLGRMYRGLRPEAGSLGAAIAKAGGRGAPLRLRWERRHGGVVSLEVVQVEARAVPREAFELPEGFREASVSAVLGKNTLEKLLGR